MASPEPDPPALAAIARTFADAAQERATRRGYLAWLPARGTVLDVGCGAGAFLDVARAAGLAATGIDRDAAAVALSRGNGHEVHLGDAHAVLRGLAGAGARFDGAVLSHVIEHLDGGAALALLVAIGAVLQPGAPLLVATPDPGNHIVLSELFWLDPTHVRPYPRLLLERLGAAAASKTTSPLGALPLSLTALGAPGCFGRVSPDVSAILIGAGNTASWSLGVPNNPAFIGMLLYNQALVLDPGLNGLGAVLSDATGMMVGN